MTLIKPKPSPCPYCGKPFTYFDARHDVVTGCCECPHCKLPCVRESQIYPCKKQSWGKPTRAEEG